MYMDIFISGFAMNFNSNSLLLFISKMSTKGKVLIFPSS